MSEVWLVVGLGNPGQEYTWTRHNIGHATVQALAKRAGGSWVGHRTRTHIADVRLGVLPGGAPGPKVVLAQSDSYMNTSGTPVGALMRFLGVDADHLLVIHDDLDIPAHQLRLKTGGGEGGHNGLKSISQVIGTRDYHRLRVGIGRPPSRMDPADFVLQTIPHSQRTEWQVSAEKAADVVEDVVINGFLPAQQRLHSSAAHEEAK